MNFDKMKQEVEANLTKAVIMVREMKDEEELLGALRVILKGVSDDIETMECLDSQG